MNELRTGRPLLLSDMAAAAGVIAAGEPTLAVAQVLLASTGTDAPVTSAWISVPERAAAASLAEALLLWECDSPEGEHYWAGAPTTAQELVGPRIDLQAAGLWVEVVDEAPPGPLPPTITLEEVRDLVDFVAAAALTKTPAQAVHVRAAAGEVEIHTADAALAQALAVELVGLDLQLRPIVRAQTP